MTLDLSLPTSGVGTDPVLWGHGGATDSTVRPELARRSDDYDDDD